MLVVLRRFTRLAQPTAVVPCLSRSMAGYESTLTFERDAYAQQIHTTVLSCEPAPAVDPQASKAKQPGKKQKKKKKGGGAAKKALPRWWVRLEDTCIFPEGGGQPSDRGYVGGLSVVDMTRDKDMNVIHVVEGTSIAEATSAPAPPVVVGEEVKVEVDWGRRYDHMQQHTAQHLISAIAADKFGWKVRPVLCRKGVLVGVVWCVYVGSTREVGD